MAEREAEEAKRSPAAEGDREPRTRPDAPSQGSAGGESATPSTQPLSAPATTTRTIAPLRALATKLGRLIVALTLAITAIVALGIVFKVLGANTHKWIVSTFEDLGRFFASPFDRMFTPHSAKVAVAVNWGIAIAVYAVVGRLLARLATRLAAATPSAARQR